MGRDHGATHGEKACRIAPERGGVGEWI